MNERRRYRLEGDIRSLLCQILSGQVSDKRLGGVTVTRVKLSRDGSHASVFYETTGTDEEKEEASRAMDAAAGFLRSRIASGVRMRIVPALSFVHDSSGEQGDRVLQIMRGIDED